MFEGHAIHVVFDDAAERQALRPLAWCDLVARIDAARDLRGVLRVRRRRGFASFGGGAAGYLASTIQSKPAVNRSALSDGKSPAGKADEAARAARDGDRDTQ